MDHCLKEDVILEFVGGRLSEDVIASIEQHADGCARCLDLIAAAAAALAGEPGATVALRERDARALGTSRILGGYCILEPLGYGGTGVVYRAVPMSGNEDVALKTLHSPARAALASIQREIRALSRLRHPGVVHILGQGVEDGRPWYAMELIQGSTLEQHLRALHEDGPPPAQRWLGTLRILRQLCETLAYVHGQGVVHRDLTPRNVVLRSDGAPILVDFGLALGNERPGRDLLGAATLAGGTLPYMAPEQIRGEMLDPRADLYALGCILYQAVVGHPPFEHGPGIDISLRHLKEAPAPPSTLVPGVEPALDTLVLRLLEKQPRHRPGYAEDIALALDQLTGAVATVPVAASRSYVYRPGFCGRAPQLDALERCLDRGERGRGGLVFISGESGLGKTRLAIELTRCAHARGFRVITGECVAIDTSPTRETERSTAFEPFRPLLRALVDTGRSSRERADRLVGPRGRALAAYEPELLGLPGQETYPELPPLPPEAARHRLFSALRETLEALAVEAPLLIVLDDLQWADDLSLGFLETLPEFFSSRRILLVGTYRSEDACARLERLARAPGSSEIALDRFDAVSIEAMVSEMLALDKAPEQLLRPLLTASEGSPFFVAEYLRVAVDEQRLCRTAGAGWTFALAQGDAALPSTLRVLVTRRLARLSAGARLLVEVAAVLGRESESDLLLAVTGLPDAEAMDAMKELVLRAIFEEVDRERLRFVHDKLREVAYDAIPEARRRELHRVAAMAIERRRGTAALPLFHAALAHHWARSGNAAHAIDHLESAGEHALATAAYAEAAGFLQRALELARDHGGAGPDPFRVSRWHRRIGEACYALGDLPRCEEHSSRALEGLGHPLPRSHAGWTVSLGVELGRQLRHLALPQREPDGAPGQRARMEDAALAAARIAHHYYFAGDTLALATVSLLSVNLAERAGAADRLSRPYAQLGYFSGVCRLRGLAERYFARARLGARNTGDPNALAVVLFHEATYHVGEGRWALAHRAGAQARALLEEIENPQENEIVHTILAHAEYCVGRYADSIARCDSIVGSARARANHRHQAWGLYAGARSLLRLGRLDEALDRLSRAEELLRHQPELPSEIICSGLAAAARLWRGELEGAEAAADRALDRMSRVSSPIFSLGDGYAGAAEVYLSLLDRGGLKGSRRDSLIARARRACAALHRFALVFPIGGPAALLAAGRARRVVSGRQSAARAFERAFERAEALGMPFETALSRLSLSRLPGTDEVSRKTHLGEARDTFVRLGCQRWLEQTGALE